MKFNYLVKATPLLTTLSLIIFLNISNQKEYTKLKILIWETPSLALGKFIAISMGTGFILSYFITTNLAKINNSVPNQSLKFKDENKYDDRGQYTDLTSYPTYENTLIERDIKDPSPTINASFRIIGKTDRISSNLKSNDDIQYDQSSELDDYYDDQPDKYENINQAKTISTDWNDESFSRW
tara:strand:+ start:99 stop:644 length:546 start_codon:yes stop_codon:yes gene_type:complete